MTSRLGGEGKCSCCGDAAPLNAEQQRSLISLSRAEENLFNPGKLSGLIKSVPPPAVFFSK